MTSTVTEETLQTVANNVDAWDDKDSTSKAAASSALRDPNVFYQMLDSTIIRESLMLWVLYNKKNKHYQDSWKKRGDIGVLLTVARKWDRIDSQIRQAMANGNLDEQGNLRESVFDGNSETLTDTIADLATYSLMWLADLMERHPSEWEKLKKYIMEFK